MHTANLALLSLLLASLAPAQSYLAAYRDLPIANRTSSGSLILQARVYYPGVAAGADQPMVQPPPGGYPVYVFLHGQGSQGRVYFQVGEAFSTRGWICVLPDTAISSSSTQIADAKATFPSLVAENQSGSSFLFGALDMARCAIGGYSMGGGSALRTLSANVGYKAGFAHAPAGSGAAGTEGQNNRMPFGVVIGQGDTVVGWQSGYNWWNLAAYTGLKTLYLMNGECNHGNVIAWGDQVGYEIYLRCMSVAVGFLESAIKGTTSSLDAVLGQQARSEARLVQVYSSFEKPPLWTQQSGRDYAIRTASEAGAFALLACETLGYQQTVAGTLGLDPQTLIVLLTGQVGTSEFFSLDFNLPILPGLYGKRYYLQSVSMNTAGKPALSNVTDVVF